MGCGTCGEIVHGAVGLAKAGLQSVGVPIDQVSDAELQRRRDICRDCPEATRNPERMHLPTKGLTTLSKCNLCGCFIAAKTKLASERCPANPPKW
jgi:hypothetical protein